MYEGDEMKELRWKMINETQWGEKRWERGSRSERGSGSLIGTGGQGQSFNDCPGWIRWKDGDGDGNNDNDDDGDSDGDDDNDDGGGTTCRCSMIASDCWGGIM